VSEKQDDAQTKHAPTESADQGGVPRKDGAAVDGSFVGAATGNERTAVDGTAVDAVAANDDVTAPATQPDPVEPTSGEPVEAEAVTTPQLRLRRAPRYLPFGLTGALIGIVAGVALALSFSAAANYSIQTIAGYFAAAFGLIGAVLGLGAAVLIERRRT
jgi:hypothetical protein